MVHAQRKSDSLENAVGVTQRLIVPKAKHAIALSFEICGAGLVGSPFQSVMAPVQLDDQLGFSAAEVRDEGADGVLAAELEAGQLPIAE